MIILLMSCGRKLINKNLPTEPKSAPESEEKESDVEITGNGPSSPASIKTVMFYCPP